MSLFDALLGRTRRKEANLDALFALPAAEVTLQAQAGLVSSGQAGVCFKPASGSAFEAMRTELGQLLELAARESSSQIREHTDGYGYRWIAVRDDDFEDLVTSVHMVNATLQERGFGSQLLCSVFGFAPEPGPPRVHVVYLYKQGTFYPFAPLSGEKRDTELELRLRGLLTADLPIEADLTRWFPLWGVPI